MRKTAIIFITVIFLMGSLFALETIPNAFYGDITFNGVGIGSGYILHTTLNGIDNIDCLVLNGQYGYGSNTCVVVNEASGSDLVEFFLCDMKIGEAVFEDKEVTKLDFILNTTPSCAVTPYCGDSTCNGAETCSTCAGDCGACVTSGDTGGNTGGGGGGGSGSGSDTELLSDTTSGSSNLIDISLEVDGRDSVGEDEEETQSGITGAVVGFAKSKGGKGLGFAIILVVLVIAILSYQKRNQDVDVTMPIQNERSH